MSFVTDCDYCGSISLCFEDEGHGTCCNSCAETHDIQPLNPIPQPTPGTYAHTARLMAELMPVDDDPDFWDRWKDEMKDRDY